MGRLLLNDAAVKEIERDFGCAYDRNLRTFVSNDDGQPVKIAGNKELGERLRKMAEEKRPEDLAAM